MTLRTCVAPSGRFVYGLHRPHYSVANLRAGDPICPLGRLADGTLVDNRRNFPLDDVREEEADWIFEIPNPFPFRGTTYIDKVWADAKAAAPTVIALPEAPPVSFCRAMAGLTGDAVPAGMELEKALAALPEPVLLALAATSTDSSDLTAIAHLCCDFTAGPDGRPEGLRYRLENGRQRPVIRRHALFETVVNNPHLPDDYKEVMVLRPGAQGGSEIVGEWRDGAHIYEYLRRNSYIPWGHYAANFSEDSVRYRVGALTAAEMGGLRHLYYQRTYVRLAEALDLPVPTRRPLSISELEDMRGRLTEKISAGAALPFDATLWGWNYGFDFAPSGYRLHASHQQIHQQFALLPPVVEAWHAADEPAGTLPSYGCGDLVADFIRQYREETEASFFEKYIEAIRANRRMDERKGENSLVVYEDGEVMLFVPKAQTSQWELQLMTVKPVGNVLEADTACRKSLDRAVFVAMRILAAMGAKMVTTIEYPKRFGAEERDQRLLYSFLPRLPESPGAFSEAQLRFINGHYPEDFAIACRSRLVQPLADLEKR
ncbi:MAG: hypothetical protein P8Y63_01375 [Deltaproteobacteria bacterium]|jgi:hypothetical protein